MIESMNLVSKKIDNIEKNKNTEDLNLEFLREQIRLPKKKWDKRFSDLISKKIKEKENLENEDKKKTPEELQKETFERYTKGLNLSPEQLKNKTILDLGCGDGDFVRYLLEKNISSNSFGVDIELEEEKVGNKFKGNFFKRDFENDLPVKNIDYIVSVGAISNGIWGGEKTINMEKILDNAIKSLKSNGEVKIFPLQEIASYLPYEGLKKSKLLWDELLEKFTKEKNIEYKIEPRDILVTGNENDVILNSVLTIKNKLK